jgi:MoaA/NifB/PqqE/SkfB family radical SAM enzyme
MKNQKLWRLTLDTNPEDCNLACTMCEEHSPHSDFMEKLYQKTGVKHRRMSGDWLEPIFDQAAQLGVREIMPSTMGEPLGYRHFGKIIALCATHQIKMNLTTNGTFPGKSVQNWAKLIVPVTSDVKISWNGATKATSEKVMIGIDFEKAKQNVRDFAVVRDRHFEMSGHYCRLTFQLTFMQNNMHELADIIRLAAELGVNRVKGHHLWAHFEEIKELSFRQNAQSTAKWNGFVGEALAAKREIMAATGKEILLENIIPLEDFEVQQVPQNYECPFLERELWISATGQYAPCCAPDEQRQSLGDFGNVQTTTIEQVLESPGYQMLVKNYKNIPLCQSCNMRKPL